MTWITLRMADALALIAERGGENYCETIVDYYDGKPHTGTCRAGGYRKRRAPYTSERWCDACVAADALGYPKDAHRNLRMVKP